MSSSIFHRSLKNIFLWTLLESFPNNAAMQCCNRAENNCLRLKYGREIYDTSFFIKKNWIEFQRVRTVRFKPYKYILKRARYIATHVPKKTYVLASANTEKCTVHSLTYSIHVLKMLATIFIVFIWIKCYDKIPSITGPRKLCQCCLLLPVACVTNWTLKGIRNSVIVPEGSRFIANFDRANTLGSQWKIKEMTKESS